MRIAWVSHSSAAGGAELALVEGVRALVDRGQEVDVAVPEAGPLVMLLRDAGARVLVARYPLWVSGGRWRTPTHRVRRVAGTVAGAGALARVLARRRPDAIVTNTLAVGSPALTARWLGVPHVWYVHEFGREDHGLHFDLPCGAAHRLMRHLSTEVIVDSQAVGRAVREWADPARVHVVAYAVDVPSLPCRPPGDGVTLRLALIGRRAPGKRQEDAIRAVGMLAARGVDVSLELVGDAEAAYEQHLRALADAGGAAGRVRFTAFTPDRFARLGDADVALMCSSSEAFGRVTVEAMKLGRPVVGADAGGTAELVRDGWNGLLYPPGDSQALALRIERLHRDRPLLRDLGARAQEWSRATFTSERYADGLLASLRRATASAGRRT
jgi:glycosyltransferase involved in cell wall biosynthesis